MTVEACNTVMLCSRASSSPLIADNSPPMPGVVKVGHTDEHSMYTSSKLVILVNILTFATKCFDNSNIHPRYYYSSSYVHHNLAAFN